MSDFAEVTQDDLYTLLVSAARYAWPRRTYIVQLTADLIQKYSKNLTNDQRKVLLRDLKEEMARWQDKYYGDQQACDRDTLADLALRLDRETE